MRRAFQRLTLTAAAATMALSPIAAQANTRAGDNSAAYSNIPVYSVFEDEEKGIGAWIYALLGVVGVVAVLVSIDDSDDQSPGT